MGNGLLTCTPKGAQLEELYSPEEMLYYEDFMDLRQQIEPLILENSWTQIAKAGRERNMRDYNAHRVAQYLIDFTFDQGDWKDASWAQYTYSQ